MLISKMITIDRQNRRLGQGAIGYWVCIKVLGIPVFTKFVPADIAAMTWPL